jgi:hypothetical protein
MVSIASAMVRHEATELNLHLIFCQWPREHC